LEDDLESAEFAAKLDVKAGPTDWSFSLFYGLEELPALSFHPILREVMDLLLSRKPISPLINRLIQELGKDEILNVDYPRIVRSGVSFAASAGPAIFRAEALYTFDHKAYTRSLALEKHNTIQYSGQVEFAIPYGLTYSMEMFGFFTQDWDESLVSPENLTFALAYLHGRFWGDRIEGYAQILYNTTRWSIDKWREGDVFGEDFEFSAKVAYHDRRRVSVGAGVFVFGGPRKQMLALLHPRSFAFVDLKVRF
jgi:hypothetical protein